MATYTITVERSDYVERIAGKEWQIINEAGERGYTPEIRKMTWVETEIYSQTVEDLDLAKLVAVVNGLNVSTI